MSAAEAGGLKRRLSSIFTRRGGNGHQLRRFEDLADAQKENLLAVTNLTDEELPVIGSYEGRSTWLLLSTERVMWCANGDVTEVPIGEVRDAIVDFDALRAHGLTKLEARHIQIVTVNGQYTVEVEQGAPFSGMWNVLRHLGVRNKRH